MFSLFVGWRFTRGQRRSQLVNFISSMSIVGLVTSVCLLIVVLAVMSGFDKEMRERILSMVQQVSVSGDNIENWESLRQQLLEYPHVVAATPFVEVAGAGVHQKQVAPFGLIGVDTELEPTVSSIMDFVSTAAWAQLLAKDNAVLLGEQLRQKLGLEIGDRFHFIIPQIGGMHASSSHPTSAISTLEVVGVFSTGTRLDHDLAITSLSSAQTIASLNGSVTGVKLKLDDLFLARQVNYSIRETIYGAYLVRDWTGTYSNLYYDIKFSKHMVSMILFLIIAIAVFNLVSTLVMVVVDKQSDIAILRTLGANTQKIIGIFMVQGCVVGLIGTGIGVGLGLILADNISAIVSGIETLLGIQFLKSDVYPVDFIPSEILWNDVATVAVVSLILSFVATLYPAWRASKVKPAEALRFDV